MDDYIVYVLTEADGRITALNSSAFLADVSGWAQIDRGISEKYGHAQNNYLPKPLIDEQGRYRYKLVDGAVTERTPEELASDPVPTPTPDQAQVNAANIDYLAMMTGVEL